MSGVAQLPSLLFHNHSILFFADEYLALLRQIANLRSVFHRSTY